MATETIMASEIGLKAIGAGLAIGLAAIATGIGQKHTLGAAIGAVSENPKLMGRAILFAVLPETALIFGFVIAFLIMGM